jgi:hypothetical protein
VDDEIIVDIARFIGDISDILESEPALVLVNINDCLGSG